MPSQIHRLLLAAGILTCLVALVIVDATRHRGDSEILRVSVRARPSGPTGSWQMIEGLWLWVPETWCDQTWAGALAAAQDGFLVGDPPEDPTRGGRTLTPREIHILRDLWEQCLYCTVTEPGGVSLPWGAPQGEPFRCNFNTGSIDEDYWVFWDHVKACNPGMDWDPDGFLDVFRRWAWLVQQQGGCGDYCAGINCDWWTGCGPLSIAGAHAYEREFQVIPGVDVLEQMLEHLGCEAPEFGCIPFQGTGPPFDWMGIDPPGGGSWCDQNQDGNLDWADLLASIAGSGLCNSEPLQPQQQWQLVLEWLDCSSEDPDTCASALEWGAAVAGAPLDPEQQSQVQQAAQCIVCAGVDPAALPWGADPPLPFDIPFAPGLFPCDLNGNGEPDAGDFQEYLDQVSWCNLHPPPGGGPGGAGTAWPPAWTPDEMVIMGAYWGNGYLESVDLGQCPPPVSAPPCHHVVESIHEAFSAQFGRGMSPQEMGDLLMLLPGPDCADPPAGCAPQVPPIWVVAPSPAMVLPFPPGGNPPCDLTGDGWLSPLDLSVLFGHINNCNPGGLSDNDWLNLGAWWLDTVNQTPGCGFDTEPCEEIIWDLVGLLTEPPDPGALGMLLELGGCPPGLPDPPGLPPAAPPGGDPLPAPGSPPVWCGAGSGPVSVSPDPVVLAYGHKLETATDLTVTVPGRDFRFQRSYSSQPDFGGSGLLGEHWASETLRFINQIGAGGPGTILEIALPTTGTVQFTRDDQSGIWIPPGPSTQVIRKVDSESPRVWRLVEPGDYEIDFYQNASGAPAALDGLIREVRDVYGNAFQYEYSVIAVEGKEVARLAAIHLQPANAVAPAADVVFIWRLGAADPNLGRLAEMRVIRWDDAGEPVITQRVRYVYKAPFDGISAAAGTTGDLIEVVRAVRVDQAPDGQEPWSVKITQYRYHGGVSKESGEDLDGDGFKNESGTAHQVKAVFLPEQLEFAVQRIFTNSPMLQDITVQAHLLLTRDDGEFLFMDGAQSVSVIDLAAKIVEQYEPWDEFDPVTFPGRVRSQYLQTACGCAGGSAQGTLLEYEYASYDLPSMNDVARTTWIHERMLGDAGYEPYRTTLYDLFQHDPGGGGPTLFNTTNVVRQDDTDGTVTKRWIVHHEFDQDRLVVATCTPASMQHYRRPEEVPGVEVPEYEPHPDTGLVQALEYNEDRRLVGVYVRDGYSPITTGGGDPYGPYTPVSRVTYDAVNRHLPVRMDQFATGSTLPDETETQSISYAFYSPQGDDIRWMQVAVEAETPQENGPGGQYVVHELYDERGQNVWSRAADDVLTRRTFDSRSGAVTLVERNADPPPSWWQIIPSGPGFHFDGRHADGGSLTSRAEVDLLGRTVKTISPSGRTNRIVRQVRPFLERPGIVYDAVTTLPHALSGPTPQAFDGPATVTWFNASGQEIGLEDFALQVPSAAGDSDFGALFPEFDYSLDSLLAHQALDHALSGLVTAHRAHHDLAGRGEGGGVSESRYEYDALGRLQDSIDANGTVTRQEYDTLDRVTAVWTGTTTSAKHRVAEYFYDSNGLPVRTGVGNGNLTFIREHVDDAATRDSVLRYDWRDRPEQVLGPEPPFAAFAHDNLNRPLKEALFGTVPSSIDDPTNRGLLLEYEYSQRGLPFRVERATDPGTSASERVAAVIWYDPLGRPVSVEQPNRPGMKVTFDGLGRPSTIYSTDHRDDVTHADVYDPPTYSAVVDDDVVFEQRSVSYIPAGASPADARAGLPELITTRLRTHDAPDGERGALDAAGVARDHVITRYTGRFYDDADRLIRHVEYGTNSDAGFVSRAVPPRIVQEDPPSAGPAAEHLIREVRYDIRTGLVDRTTDPMGFVQKLFYDDLYRPIATVENYSDASITWDPDLNRWTASGMSQAEPDRDRVTSVVLDGVGHIRQQIAHVPGGAGTGDQVTEYVYDALDGPGAGDSRLNSHDLLTEIHFPDETTGQPGTGDAYTVRYAYNRLGELRSTRDQNGSTHTYTRDGLGRVIRDDAIAGPGIDDVVRAITAAFDDLGRPSVVRSLMQGDQVRDAVEFQYTPLWQIEQFTQHHDGDLTSPGQTIARTYDTRPFDAPDAARNLSRLAALVYPRGDEVRFHYGETGDASDRIARLTGLGDIRSAAHYQYLGLGAIVSVRFPTPGVGLDRSLAHNGSFESGAYPGFDRFGRVRRQVWADDDFRDPLAAGPLPAKPPIVERAYDYDNAGNRLSAIDARPGASGPNRDALYAYDELHRLVDARRGAWNNTAQSLEPSFTTGARSQQWQLDTLGNHLMAATDIDGDGLFDGPGEQLAGLFNLANELSELTLSGSPAISLPFQYDDAGNLQEQALDEARTVRYTHDAWNRLVRVEVIDGGVPQPRAEYQYNGLHHRTVKRSDTSTPPDGVLDEERWMYYSADWRLLFERVDDAAQTQPGVDRELRYVWGIRAPDDILYHQENTDFSDDGAGGSTVTYDRTYYHLTDVLFSTVALVNDAGRIIERLSYDAYGTARHSFPADLDGDGAVTESEVQALAALARPPTPIGDPGYLVELDLDRDGLIAPDDIALVGLVGEPGSGPVIMAALAPGALSAVGNTIGYAGYVFNPEVPGAGLYTVRYRCYDPATGRWLERDPAGYVDGMSLYEYVRGQPIVGVDPWGLYGGTGMGVAPRNSPAERYWRDKFDWYATWIKPVGSVKYSWWTRVLANLEWHDVVDIAATVSLAFGPIGWVVALGLEAVNVIGYVAEGRTTEALVHLAMIPIGAGVAKLAGVILKPIARAIAASAGRAARAVVASFARVTTLMASDGLHVLRGMILRRVTRQVGRQVLRAASRQDVRTLRALQATPKQIWRALNDPNGRRFLGTIVDNRVKRILRTRRLLRRLFKSITIPGRDARGRFTYGPDLWNPRTMRGWDITTPGEWAKHLRKYVTHPASGRPQWRDLEPLIWCGR